MVRAALDTRLADLDLLGGRPAAGFTAVCLPYGTVRLLNRDQLLLDQPDQSVRFASCHPGRDARLLSSRNGRRAVPLRNFKLGTNIVIPKLEQHLPSLHTIALTDRKARDLPAVRWRQLRPLAGLYGSRPGVRHGLGNITA
jgi:hypothetical protein